MTEVLPTLISITEVLSTMTVLPTLISMTELLPTLKLYNINE